MWETELIEYALNILKNFQMELWQIDEVEKSESFIPAIKTLEEQLKMLNEFKIKGE